MEAVARESESIQDGNSESLPGGGDTNVLELATIVGNRTMQPVYADLELLSITYVRR